MFGTFPSAPECERSDDNSASSKPRPKRRQVNRACVWCRTYRIKCDANHPCGNCAAKGRKCTIEDSKDQVRTFPSAIKEIDSLRERVKELESQIRNLQLQNQTQEPSPEPSSKIGRPYIKQEESLPEELDPLSQHGGNRKYYNWDFVTREIKPGSNQIYGSSSTYYFINRLSSYLDTSLQKKLSESTESLRSLLSSTAQELYSVLAGRHSVHLDDTAVKQDLPRLEEEQLIGLFWSSWHPLYPILDQDAFRAYYETLWSTNNEARDPSALVDIVLALGVQYEAALIASRTKPDATSISQPTDSAAGWWFYRRCNYFLQDDLENPSITVFQCHLLAVVWLSGAQWHNTAHNVLAAGLRIGVILGLHLEPCPELPLALREYRKRIWWTMYTIDMQYAMQFGRPLGVHFGQVACSLPNDDRLSEKSIGTLAPSSFGTQIIRLTLASRAIYIQFYRVCAQVLRQSGQTNIYNDLSNLEVCADWLDTNIRYMQAWLKQVPETLKIRRENMGQPYSTDRSRLDMSSPAGTVSRSCLLLEIAYHHFAMDLYRPFITFTQNRGRNAIVTERHAISCVNHAIAITLIIQQDISESETLRAWHMICLWQWNAALSLAGYVLTYPCGPSTVTAREILSTAISSFDLLSNTFANAFDAATSLRSLVGKTDMLVGNAQLSNVVGRSDDRALLPSSVTIQDLDEIESPFKELSSHLRSNVPFTWTDPELNLSEFSTSEDHLPSEDWAFDLLGFGSMADL